MARIEKTIFISYRRADVYTALAVYENLKNQGYDVFFDYRSISSGDFEQIITANIRARAHFLLILTPTALDRCNEPGDWLRREIELAIDERRNIIPLFFRGFRFGAPSVSERLTGKLGNLSRYNGLNVHEDYFDEAMQRLRAQYLNIPLDTVLHPVSNTVQKIVIEEKIAADKALEQIDDVQELVKHADEKPAKPEAKSALRPARKFPPPARAGQNASEEVSPRTLPDLKSITSKLNLRFLRLVVGTVLAIIAVVLVAKSNFFAPKLGIGSTMVSEKDGMTLLYVPAGDFTMGSDNGDDEKPVNEVTLDAFWIDKTEVTNAMYAKCVRDGACNQPNSTNSWTRDGYYGNSEFDNFPVIYVSWNDAKAYCEWAGRRLPTEAEWEKAARGDDGRMYPWGDDAPNNNLLNYNGAVGDTTEVGKYPGGASPYGALDMAGNVWEWVSSLHKPYPYSPTDGREDLSASGAARVLRGGVWRDVDNAVRSADRSSNDPLATSNYTGFRCASSADEQTGSNPFVQVATDTAQPIATDPRSATQIAQLTSTGITSPTETSIPPTPALVIGSTLTGEDGMTLLYVPAGEFTMGSDSGNEDEKPVRIVYLDAFWIDQTEVTNAMYALCVKAGICNEPTRKGTTYNAFYYGNKNFEAYPVVYVNWDMAKIYCAWAKRRLPTEAEWEKAARGPDGGKYPWGDDPPSLDLLNYNQTSGLSTLHDTTEVGTYPTGASPYGVMDMGGNVWEWVADWYSATYYINAPASNPMGPDSGQRKVVRGGNYNSGNSDVRSANRADLTMLEANNGLGFRCAMDATP